MSTGVISIYFHNSFELDNVFFVLDIQVQFQIFQVHIGRILQNPKHPPRSGVISECTCFLLHLVHFCSNVCLGRYLESLHKIAQMQERGKGLRLAIEEKEVSELSEGHQVKGNSSWRLAPLDSDCATVNITRTKNLVCTAQPVPNWLAGAG